MAFLSDVQNALVSAIGAAVWPGGAGQVSVAGVNGLVFAGWPAPIQLTADLQAGKFQISVFPMPGMERNTTRYPQVWREAVAPVVSVSAEVSGSSVILSGVVSAGTLVVVLVGDAVFRYVATAGDSLASVAAALAALLAVDYAGSVAAGAVISLPAGADLRAVRVGAMGSAIQEIRRELRQVMVSVWAPSPVVRDAVGNCLDVALSTPTFLTMPDLTGARIRYVSSRISDSYENVQLYRRDMIYEMEWGVTVSEDYMQVLSSAVDVALGDDL